MTARLRDGINVVRLGWQGRPPGYPSTMDSSAVRRASEVLLEAVDPHDTLVQFVRDPVTGETGLVVAARGRAGRDLLQAIGSIRPSLGRRLARSLAAPDTE